MMPSTPSDVAWTVLDMNAGDSRYALAACAVVWYRPLATSAPAADLTSISESSVAPVFAARVTPAWERNPTAPLDAPTATMAERAYWSAAPVSANSAKNPGALWRMPPTWEPQVPWAFISPSAPDRVAFMASSRVRGSPRCILRNASDATRASATLPPVVAHRSENGSQSALRIPSPRTASKKSYCRVRVAIPRSLAP